MLVAQLRAAGMEAWAQQLPAQVATRLDADAHGDMPRWRECLRNLPTLSTNTLMLDGDKVRVGSVNDCDDAARVVLTKALQGLMPWRKGPFDIYGVPIDTEWRSDWKWRRLAAHIAPLAGRKVLDIGCGNGYHCWRMAGAGADLVVGVDPTQLFLMQFLAVRHFLLGHADGAAIARRVHLLPLGIEDLPARLARFDTVFSMGVLYHRRSPIDHLYELKGMLRPGGEVVLETLVIAGDEGQVLVPPGRYAKMRNVWFIPSVPTLEAWLRRCGFHDVRTVDVTVTSVAEQRATDWMGFESLADFLDPADTRCTVENHPAPTRAIVLARV